MYYQLNIDYIIETYCVNTDKPELQCNGKCHLAKQLTALDTTDDSGKAVLSLFDSFFPVFSENISPFEFNSHNLYMAKQKIAFSTQNYMFNFEYFHFKPPMV